VSRFVIEGGHALSGTIRPGGNKNEALPCIAAALLTDEPVILDNVPRIRDVDVLLEVLRRLGADVEELGSPNRIRIQCRQIATVQPDHELCAQLRASILLMGPILARTGEVVLPPPGGDVIGRRRLDTHFLGFEALGAEVQVGRAYDVRRRGRLRGADIFLDEASVTATENIVMAAALADGVTTIRNAASEPHVQNLCRMLQSMGVGFEGIGSNTLVIEGRERLGGCEFKIGPDYLEVGSFIGLAACTGSDIRIEGAGCEHLRRILMTFERLGVHVERVGDDDLHIRAPQPLVIRHDVGGAIPKLDDAPWPAFPTDLMSIAIVTATQAKGTVLVFEKMYEGRMFFVDHLIGMGAQIILCDPHRVVVVGPSPLYASRVESPDVRAGMALLIAALCAKGKTTIGNIRQIDRGYERIDEKLRALGAHIERVAE